MAGRCLKLINMLWSLFQRSYCTVCGLTGFAFCANFNKRENTFGEMFAEWKQNASLSLHY